MHVHVLVLYFIIHGPPSSPMLHLYLWCVLFLCYGLFMIVVPSNSLIMCNIGDEGMTALGAAAKHLSNVGEDPVSDSCACASIFRIVWLK